jgi:hemerythrin-like domain-containing protein
MLDDIAFLDDATRPEAPRLEGLTPAQREPGQHLIAVHNHLRENMHSLGRLIEQASAGTVTPADVEKQTADLTMVSNYRRFGNLCGQHCQFVDMHHSIEDQAIFPAIARQGEAFRKIADRLRAEHVVVHELLVRLIAALDVLARDPNQQSFAAARDLYQALERVLLSHLGYEEESIGDALGYFSIA